MKAVDLDGVEWRVRRRWLPRYEGKGLRERNRQRKARRAKRDGDGAGHILDGLDLPDPGGDSLVAWVVLVVGVLLLFVLAVWGFVFVLALVDLVIVLLVAVVGIVARVVFRRPWTVGATAPDGRPPRAPGGRLAPLHGSGQRVGRRHRPQPPARRPGVTGAG